MKGALIEFLEEESENVDLWDLSFDKCLAKK